MEQVKLTEKQKLVLSNIRFGIVHAKHCGMPISSMKMILTALVKKGVIKGYSMLDFQQGYSHGSFKVDLGIEEKRDASTMTKEEILEVVKILRVALKGGIETNSWSKDPHDKDKELKKNYFWIDCAALNFNEVFFDYVRASDYFILKCCIMFLNFFHVIS